MIRLIQKRLIIPRGDTGTFSVPVLAGKDSDDISIFTIFDPLTHKKILEKKIEPVDGMLHITFTHGDTVNLPIGQYVWDIKFYSDPVFVDEQLVDGVEVDSYYALFNLPVCEIRETGDNMLYGDDTPTATLAPDQIDLITRSLADIHTSMQIAADSATAAEQSAASASNSATTAETSASSALDAAANALENKNAAAISAQEAAESVARLLNALPTKISDLIDDSGHYIKPASGIPASDLAEGVIPEAIIPVFTRDMTSQTPDIYTCDMQWNEVEAAINNKTCNTCEVLFINQYGTSNDYLTLLGINGEDSEYIEFGSVTVYDSETRNKNIKFYDDGTVEYTYSYIDLNTKADKVDTILDTTLSRGRKIDSIVGVSSFAFGESVEASGDQSHAEGAGTTASGNQAHAEGVGTTASGSNSHSEGAGSKATNNYAHAEGNGTIASGESSHAEGVSTTASANYAHAEGAGSQATGVFSHAEGSLSIASQTGAHAEGVSTQANGYYSHAEGQNTKATSNASHAEGNSTNATGSGAHAEGNSTTASATGSHSEGNSTTASADAAHSEGTGTIASGIQAHAEGVGTTASGQNSHAEGANTNAIGNQSHAEGVGGSNKSYYYYVYVNGQKVQRSVEKVKTGAEGSSSHSEGNMTTADGYGSHSEGVGAIAHSDYAHAEGYETYAGGSCAHAEGNRTTASAVYSHAEGDRTIAQGNYTHAEGSETIAVNPGAHAEGVGTKALDDASHAEGNITIASGNYTHAEGLGSIASDDAAHAEGGYTQAKAYYAHAEGNRTQAKGEASHTEGKETIANGIYTHAEGMGTVATADASHVQGKYNIPDTLRKYAHIVGNGTATDSSNAHTLDWDGNAWYAGKVTVEGTPTDANDLTTKQYVDSTIPTNVSQLTNDAGYLTQHQDISGKADKSEIPTSVSELTNDAGYITGYTETDPTVPAWAKASTKPSYTAAEVGAPTVAEMNSAIGDAIGNVHQFEVEIVQELPVENIKEHTVYFVPKSGATDDVYDEYVYIDNAWEMIGNTQIDLSNYVQKTDYATTDEAGIVKIGLGFTIDSTHTVSITTATDAAIKAGTTGTQFINPRKQHASVFYGLAKVAGDTTQAQSSNTIGTYTDEAKTAIRTMLGVATPADIPTNISAFTNDAGYLTQHQDISGKANAADLATVATSGSYEDLSNKPTIPEVPVQDVQVNGTSILSNGIVNIPRAGGNTLGVVQLNNAYGVTINSDGVLQTYAATASQIKSGRTSGGSGYRPIVPSTQYLSAFYGLADAAGDTTQKSSNNAVGTYTESAKTAIRSMIGATSSNVIAVQDTQPTEVDAKIWMMETAPESVEVPTMEDMADYVQKTDIATDTTAGIVKVIAGNGISISGSTNALIIAHATSAQMKNGVNQYNPITADGQHYAVYYGLSKVAGVDLASETVTVGTYPETSKTAIRTMIGAISNTDYATSSVAGVAKVNTNYGVQMTRVDSSSPYEMLAVQMASAAELKAGTNYYKPAVPANIYQATFYGLAKAAGDTTMASSSNAVGTYTTEAKAAIRNMLGVETSIELIETVSGTTPVIVGQPNITYQCGEVSTISITPPVNGTIDVYFTSGSTAAVLTVPSTIKWPAWFDVEALESDTIYELMITNGTYGSVMTWQS